MYLLDTSFIIAVLREKQPTLDVLREVNEEILTSVVSVGELFVGINLASPMFREIQLHKTTLFIEKLNGVLPITNEVALKFGQVKANLQQKGQLIGDNDTWIAATCLTSGATLLTLNKKHFQQVPGLQIN